MKKDGMLIKGYVVSVCGQKKTDISGTQDSIWDDIRGAPVDLQLVNHARKEDMVEYRKHECTHVPIEELLRVT